MRELIEQARRAQQENEQRHDVQLELAPPERVVIRGIQSGCEPTHRGGGVWGCRNCNRPEPTQDTSLCEALPRKLRPKEA